MNEERYKDYIIDHVQLIIEKLKELPQDSDHDLGQAMAYYDVLDIMKSQAEIFNIPLKNIGLENINFEEFIMRKKV